MRYIVREEYHFAMLTNAISAPQSLRAQLKNLKQLRWFKRFTAGIIWNIILYVWFLGWVDLKAGLSWGHQPENLLLASSCSWRLPTTLWSLGHKLLTRWPRTSSQTVVMNKIKQFDLLQPKLRSHITAFSLCYIDWRHKPNQIQSEGSSTRSSLSMRANWRINNHVLKLSDLNI